MGADGGRAAAVVRHKEPAVTSNKETSKNDASNSNTSNKGALDVCDSISEYLVQLHAAAPSIHPVPCGSFFTVHTTLADLTGSSSSSSSSGSSSSFCRSCSSSSSIARDLFAAVTQRPAEGDPKAFKAFAKNFHEAASHRLAAAAKRCSVCGASQQELDGDNAKDWGLCLLPHLSPAKRLKSFPLPEARSLLVAASHGAAAVAKAAVSAVSVLAFLAAGSVLIQVACGRCLGVIRLSELLAKASANVMGDSPSSAAAGEGALAAVLKHFTELNTNGRGPQGPMLYARGGCSSSNSEGLQQQSAVAAGKRKISQPVQLSAQAQQRALDVSLAAAFAIQLLSKEVPWKLRGPTDTLQQLLARLVQTSSAAAASSTSGVTLLRPIKSEPEVEAPKQQRKLQRAKQSRLGSNISSREKESLPSGITEGPKAAEGEPLEADACDQHRQNKREKKKQKQQSFRARKTLKVA
ncbi:hypothetical protein Emed_004844 [Eimeria media]